MPPFDIVGVGLNATDTLIVLPHFPAYAGKVAFRPAISNWRTTERDVDAVLEVTRELAARIVTVV